MVTEVMARTPETVDFSNSQTITRDRCDLEKVIQRVSKDCEEKSTIIDNEDYIDLNTFQL